MRNPAAPIHTTQQDELRAHLLQQSKDWLVEQLLATAQVAPLLRAALEAGPGAQPAIDLTPILSRLDRAAIPERFVGYSEATSYADNFRAELAAIDELLAAGYSTDAVEVLEHAIMLLEEMTGSVDDSDGELGAILTDAQLTHAAACAQAKPDPVELADRLAAWALASEWEVFLNSPTTHAEALGPEGLDAFELIIDERFDDLPVLDETNHGHDHRGPSRFTIFSLKTQLAARRGTDAVVEVLSRDLSTVHDYLQIARLLAEDAREAEALDWVDRGRKVDFGGYQDHWLDDFAADLHRRLGDHSLATEMVAQRFVGSPSVANFHRLRDFATDSGDWANRRATALKLLRALPTGPGAGESQAYPGGLVGHDVLVTVLLAEGDVDAAWQAAMEGGCGGDAWHRVANARGAQHPADAVTVLQKLTARELLGGNRSAYQRGALLAQRAHQFADAAGLTADSTSWILAVREANRRRPALQDEFDKQHLPGGRQVHPTRR